MPMGKVPMPQNSRQNWMYKQSFSNSLMLMISDSPEERACDGVVLLWQ